MSRLGMSPKEAGAVAADLHALEGIDLRLVMSHLACADEPGHPANEAQRIEFDRLRAMLPAAPASLANSSGIFLGESYHHQLARSGAALYGINPTPRQENPMLPVIRLQSRVIQTRTVEKGAGIGYGHTATAEGVQRLATISLGYADGWHRCAASAARFDGTELPFVGRVSMDSIILDISALPEGRLRPGDLVDLIDADQTIDDVAGSYGTIAYEVLTSLGHRFHRIYVGA
jgi:alanine racemase